MLRRCGLQAVVSSNPTLSAILNIRGNFSMKPGDKIKCIKRDYACYDKLATITEMDGRQVTVQFTDGGKGLLFPDEIVIINEIINQNIEASKSQIMK